MPGIQGLRASGGERLPVGPQRDVRVGGMPGNGHAPKTFRHGTPVSRTFPEADT